MELITVCFVGIELTVCWAHIGESAGIGLAVPSICEKSATAGAYVDDLFLRIIRVPFIHSFDWEADHEWLGRETAHLMLAHSTYRIWGFGCWFGLKVTKLSNHVSHKARSNTYSWFGWRIMLERYVSCLAVRNDWRKPDVRIYCLHFNPGLKSTTLLHLSGPPLGIVQSIQIPFFNHQAPFRVIC